MSHFIEIKTDVFKESMTGYIFNEDFDTIQEMFYQAREKYEKEKYEKEKLRGLTDNDRTEVIGEVEE